MSEDVAKELSRVADALADIAETLLWFRALMTETILEDEIRSELAAQAEAEVAA